MEKGEDIVAELMRVAAVTAPKAAGQDFIEVKICTHLENELIVKEMLKMGVEKGAANWDRDAKGVENSEILVLIGVMPHKGIGLNCGACGFGSCAEFNKASAEGDFHGPNCMLRLLDLGIALGSAVKTAQIHNVDNRIMYRAGAAAKRLGLMKSSVIMGIPLSISGKNIYFDR
ncbi:MAG: hypothetical protein KKH41_02085 [Candidatus Thermoplasmatota archaeon]|nr:hypothetical protein [Euryarchaeota archaeon]MBU4032986.1 hypothetical protein [Candidatus Thermoplasmatota archaeon]MBU4071185.1 hypothetical protein [Candidatus Thermoplasmatota archaeon]MBU4143596.1 hypothetical protein [Candidatus Thermoplasmatota archaeon]MBU4591351.1 hypothetical protein [Candidatus Thermoplasmatota archaeon]